MNIDLIIDSSPDLSFAFSTVNILENHNLLLVSYDKEILEKQKKALLELGKAKIDIYQVEEDYNEIFLYIKEQDYLINKVFLNIDYYFGKSFLKYGSELTDIIKINNINYTLLIQNILKIFEKQKFGLVININNTAYQDSLNDNLEYAMNQFKVSLIESLNLSYQTKYYVDNKINIKLMNYEINKDKIKDNMKIALSLQKKLNKKI